MADATEEYRGSCDPFRTFTNMVFVEDRGGKVKASDAYRLLMVYGLETATRQFEHMTETAFGLKMSSRYAKRRFASGMFYLDLSVRESWFSHLDKGAVSTQKSEETQ